MRKLLIVIVMAGCNPTPMEDGGAVDLGEVDAVVPPDLVLLADLFNPCLGRDALGVMCISEMGDGGLMPGAKCLAEQCAPPIRCIVDAVDFSGECDGGTCCQFIATDNGDGTFTRWRNCGNAWECVDICTYITIPADGECPPQRIRQCGDVTTCLSGCDGGPHCNKA